MSFGVGGDRFRPSKEFTPGEHTAASSLANAVNCSGRQIVLEGLQELALSALLSASRIARTRYMSMQAQVTTTQQEQKASKQIQDLVS